MFPESANQFRHPLTHEPLTLRADEVRDGEVVTGSMAGHGNEFPIVRGIPRFCPPSNYADSFGYEWQAYSSTQLDSRTSWGDESQTRLSGETQWPQRLEGERILEAGSGMGRFTEVLARTGATVCTFDYSAAVDANYANNHCSRNVCFAQADLFCPPYELESFDKVLCIGVIQHTPSPRRAFESLVPFVKPGGQIVTDVYRLSWKSLMLGKYYVRPITRRLPPRLLHRVVKTYVAWVYPFTGFLHKIVGRRARTLSWALAMADYRGVYPMSDATAREMSELDTFDMLSPAYDRPQTLGRVRRWLAEAGLTEIEVCPGYGGIVARGTKSPGSRSPS